MNESDSVLFKTLQRKQHVLPTVMLCEIVGWLR